MFFFLDRWTFCGRREVVKTAALQTFCQVWTTRILYVIYANGALSARPYLAWVVLLSRPSSSNQSLAHIDRDTAAGRSHLLNSENGTLD